MQFKNLIEVKMSYMSLMDKIKIEWMRYRPTNLDYKFKALHC